MELNTLSLMEILSGYRNLTFSPVSVMESCLKKIKDNNPKTNAILTQLDEATLLNEAVFADEHLSAFGAEKAFAEFPLLGVPYVCKDNFNTKDILTTASSNVLKDYIAPYESTVTQKLKNAGAILIGKTNMDAFAHGSSTETSDFGTSHNPHDETRSPGGSSGGSAVAVAANMCTFAIGSETAGSVRGPASWCGVTGLKPTYGRVSRYGLISMASSTDCPGLITKTAEDSAFLLKIIAGKDPLDATSSETPLTDYGNKLTKKLRIGKPKSYFDIELEPDVRKSVEEAIEKLKSLGHEIIEMDLLSPKYAIAVYTILQRAEVSSNLARFDGIRYGQDRTHFGFEAKKRMMLGAYTLSAGYYDNYYSKAQKVRTLIVNDFNKAFEKVDVIVGPTMPCIAPKIGESEKSAMFGELIDVLAEPSSIAGLPGISIPCGISQNMPVGLQFIGKMFEEETLLGIANQFQEITDFHKKIC